MEIVAELTYNHLGDIKIAQKMISSAKKSGATCVKFELRNNEYYFKNNSIINKKKSRYEFSEEQVEVFINYCKRLKIDWFASVHDIVSLKKVLKYNPKYIKVASREARCYKFLEKIAAVNEKRIPIVVSTGALSFRQIEKIYRLLKDEKLILLHTSCLYPCEVKFLNMNRIKLMKERFNCRTGYSGHEIGFIPSLYAVFLGIEYLERHFTINRHFVAKGKEGFKDDLCTLTPHDFKVMADCVRKIILLKNQRINIGINKREFERVNAYGKVSWDGDVFLKSL